MFSNNASVGFMISQTHYLCLFLPMAYLRHFRRRYMKYVVFVTLVHGEVQAGK